MPNPPARPLLRPAAVALAAGLLLTACGEDSTSDAGAAGQPQVVAAFYPLAYVADRVAGDDASVANLTSPGTDSHAVELNPQQVAMIADADLVLVQHGFQAAVDEAVNQNAEGVVLDVAGVVELKPAPDGVAGHAHDHDGDHADGDDHADGHDHEHEEGDGHHHGDDPGPFDPHQWLDPTNMVAVAEAVRDDLVEVDPDNADGYEQRAAELVEELEALDEEYATTLASCEQDVVVSSHSAFGYLADRYDLHMIGIAGLEADAEPSPSRLSEVADIAQESGVTTIFYERLVSPAVADALASDLGLDTAVLDPIEGLTDDTEDEDYLSIMRSNLDALRTANRCS